MKTKIRHHTQDGKNYQAPHIGWGKILSVALSSLSSLDESVQPSK